MVQLTRSRVVAGHTRSERLKQLIEFLSGDLGLEVFQRAFVQNMGFKVAKYSELSAEVDRERAEALDTIRLNMRELKRAADVDGDSDNWSIFETISGAYRDSSERAAKFATLKASAEAKLAQIRGDARAPRDELLSSLRALAVHDAQLHVVDRVSDVVASFLKDPSLFKMKFTNIMLVGSAGSGKTTLAAAIGRVFAHAGMFVGDRLIQAGRAELVAQYEGQTVARTRSFLTSNLDSGVIFIDEAYALTQWADGRPEAYGAEAASAMVEFMTRYAGLYCIIVAGYEREMVRYFCASNDGMSRRFPYKFVLRALSPQELVAVFQLHLQLQFEVEDVQGMFRSEAWRYLIRVVRAATEGVSKHVEEYDPATRRSYCPVHVFIPALSFLYRLFEHQAGSMVTLAEEAVQVLLAKQPLGAPARRDTYGEDVMREIVQRRIQNCALSSSELFLHELRSAERC